MASELRQILNHIAASRLRDMCEKRGLPTGGDQHEKRERLARSFRGKVGELLPHLNRVDMIEVLESYTYYDADHPEFSGKLTGLGRASRAEIDELMVKIFEEGWGPTRARPHPLGSRSVIQFAQTNDNRDEDDDDEDSEDSEDEDTSAIPWKHGDILKARYRGELFDPVRFIRSEGNYCFVHWAADGTFSEILRSDIEGRSSLHWPLDLAPPDVETENDVVDAEDDGSSEASFLRWIDEHLGQRERMNLLVKTLVNRLGRFTADLRLSTRAVQDLARTLSTGGFVTEPDLRSMERSPGIESRVTITRAGQVANANRRDATWAPVPPPPAPGARSGVAPQPPPPQSGVATTFERAALKLQFLVLVAAAVRRPDETERRLAVDLAARALPLNAADQIRLRALAHQYASGHGDLNQVVPRLRAVLGDVERVQLLEDIRALAPATAELDELVAVYATDLGISALPPPPPPSAPAVTPPPIAPTAAPVADSEPSAGGVRTNAALDALFDMEPRS